MLMARVSKKENPWVSRIVQSLRRWEWDPDASCMEGKWVKRGWVMSPEGQG